MASRSYWACRFSISWLFRGPEARSLSDPPAPKSCKLWTYTFADPSLRTDPGRALDTWIPLGEWLRKTGKQCVRVLEQGEKGAWHFHAVTPDWWDVTEVRRKAEYLGFGRINAKEIPIEHAHYVAKYVGKSHGKLKMPPGRRQWACVGFKGVSSKDIRYHSRTVVVLRDEPREFLVHEVVWKLGSSVLHRVRLRPPHDASDGIHMIELKPAQAKELTATLARGDIVALGEYRGCNVKIQPVDDWKTKQKVDRVVVEHACEINASPVVVSQWLPAGADAKAVKAPANRGELVVIHVSQMKRFRGQATITTEKITPLSALPLS